MAKQQEEDQKHRLGKKKLLPGESPLEQWKYQALHWIRQSHFKLMSDSGSVKNGAISHYISDGSCMEFKAPSAQ